MNRYYSKRRISFLIKQTKRKIRCNIIIKFIAYLICLRIRAKVKRYKISGMIEYLCACE